MLPLSKKPEIIRLHDLEQNERDRFTSQFSQLMQDYIPRTIWSVLPLLGDIYFSYILICRCRRRLGEEYTYVAMYNEKHYAQEGVLINKKYRYIMFILEILQRHLVKLLFTQLMIIFKNTYFLKNKYTLQQFVQYINVLGIEGIFQEGRLFMMMLFLLGSNKSYNLVDTILGTRYAYTFKNQKQKNIDYRIEGCLLLSVFVVKFGKLIFHLATNKTKKAKEDILKVEQNNSQSQLSQNQICRICYDSIKNKSSTFCGHIFCWSCIIKYLQSKSQCPICKSSCKPRQVVQLQNY